MRTGSPLLLRIFLIMLAVGNLALLAKRLLPWNDVRNLPVNGTTGIDPMVVLVLYIGLIIWISDSSNREFLRGLTIATGIGVLGGAALAEQVVLSTQPQGQSFQVHVGLLVAAAVLTGVAGLLGSRTTKNPGNGIVFGAWCAMVSGMIGCGTVLLEMNVYAQQTLPPDPWKQYQGLAIGNAATQLLVHSLLTATGFILIGPLVGAVLGVVFAMVGPNQKH